MSRIISNHSRAQPNIKKYGLPKVKKFPMPDAKHVMSAIKFFNYVKPSEEHELANAIIARIEEYGMDPESINVGDNNRFKAYFEKSFLTHHGIKGQKWGTRNGPPYPLGKHDGLRAAQSIYDTLDNFDYGCVINGKRYNETNLDKVDWSKYRTTPVSKMDKTKIGTCWDFTNYQDYHLTQAGIPHKTHMLVMDTDDGPVTHTFTTFYDENTDATYWLEQALYSERGIHKVDSYMDVVDKVSKRYDPTDTRAYDVFEFNTTGMDKGLSDQEFFDKATAGDPVYQRSDISHSSLTHHGIKGQKWGVRRYQNTDGSLTEEGVYHYRKLNAAKTKSDVDKIWNSMSYEDKALMGAEKNSREFLSYDEGEYLVKRFLDKDGDTPVAWLDIMTTTKPGHLTVAIGTNPDYRKQGRAQKLAKKGVEWFDRNAERLNADYLGWGAYAKNIGSRRIAENAGFTYEPDKSSDDWSVYGRRHA